ncbi:uncharacterized protein LOC135262746 isoform X2 [Anguilla rostrata]
MPPQAMRHGVLPQSQCMAGQNQQSSHRFIQWVQLPFQAQSAYTVPQYICTVSQTQGTSPKDGQHLPFVPLLPGAPLVGRTRNAGAQGAPLQPNHLQAPCVSLHCPYAPFGFHVLPGMSLWSGPGLHPQTGSQTHLTTSGTARAPEGSSPANLPQNDSTNVSEFRGALPTSPSLQAFGDGPAFVFPEVLSLADAMRIFQCDTEAEMTPSGAVEEQTGAVPGPGGGDGAQTQEDTLEDMDWATSVQRLLASQTPDRSIPLPTSAEHTVMDFFGDLDNYGHLLDSQFGESMQPQEDSLENDQSIALW